VEVELTGLGPNLVFVLLLRLRFVLQIVFEFQHRNFALIELIDFFVDFFKVTVELIALPEDQSTRVKLVNEVLIESVREGFK